MRILYELPAGATSSGARIRLDHVRTHGHWLILNNDSHPFGDEEYMTVTLTTTPHDEGI